MPGVKNLAGALHTDEGGCTLSVGVGGQNGMLAKTIRVDCARNFQDEFRSASSYQICGLIKRTSRPKLEEKS